MDNHTWYTPPETDTEEEMKHRATHLTTTVMDLESRQREVHEQFLCSARLYANREVATFDWGNYEDRFTSMAPLSLLGENLVQSVVDTLVSMIGKNRVKPTPVPHNASFKMRREIKKLDRWLYGEFVRMKMFQIGKRQFRNSLVFNVGGIRMDVENNKLCPVELVPDNVIIDQAEVEKLGFPRHVYERECLPMSWVEAQYDCKLEEKEGKTDYLNYRKVGAKHVIVVRGFRAKGPDGPGRYVVACQDKILYEEEWDEDWLPYAFYHYNEPLSGFYWPSIAEQIIPYQIRLNEVNEVIRDAQDLMARPRVLVAEGSQVTPLDLDNAIGRILRYRGIKPEAITWQAVSAELYGERDRVVRTCMEQFGIMQLVSQGRLPQGARLDSARALNEATTISDDRQADPIQRYEEWYLAVAELMIRMMKKYKLKYASKAMVRKNRVNVVQSVDWSEIDLDNDSYSLTLEPASVFSMTPAARRDTLEEWLRSGKIDLAEYRRLESHPDLEQEMDILSAAADYTDFVCDEIEEGNYIGPTEVEDLVNGVVRVTNRYLLLAAYTDVPQEVKTNYLKWIAMARAIMEDSTEAPPAPPMQPMAPSMSGATGMNVPVM